MRYYEWIREEGRRMDNKIKVGDTVTLKCGGPDDPWVGVVEDLYRYDSDLWADVTYMDGIDTVGETILLNDLELYPQGDDNVNSPAHYGNGSIECIDYIQDFLNSDEFQGYLRGNIAKYLHRWPYKNGVEDLKKAQWYLNKLIETTEEK